VPGHWLAVAETVLMATVDIEMFTLADIEGQIVFTVTADHKKIEGRETSELIGLEAFWTVAVKRWVQAVPF
jgi:hypothetical protein